MRKPHSWLFTLFGAAAVVLVCVALNLANVPLGWDAIVFGVAIFTLTRAAMR